ncbi:TIGR02594 family protein [Bradyrhizobium sediminis]|uniref:TIGR02594 family protein n=1 Tax=Bradyrhizobium sediminis TaxID=2840469 RepID=A0A975NGA2_9BRAD|nr:TIGR02594 family protein [Bradyrhizobium sediminis]QWG14016.1 TIGR02594 family protein [Bradyrhizobium sediminis]
MVQLFAFCRSLRKVSLHAAALALCSAAVVASLTPASARPHHSAAQQARAHHAGHHAHHHYRHNRHRHIARGSRWERGVAKMQARGLADANAGIASGAMAAPAGFGSSDVVAEARRHLGGNPTGRGSLWCARFMNMVLERSGHRGTGSDMARSFASYGQRVSGPQVGAIAVMGRRGGGHVGVVSGIDAHGNPIVVSGNNGNRVREAPVSRGRIYAYVMPN